MASIPTALERLTWPPGLELVPDAVSSAAADQLAARIDAAPLTPFQFGQWEGKRLTMNYGSAYDFQRARPVIAPSMPAWLRKLCDHLAPQFGRDPADFTQALLTRYDPGAGIGWHRDRPQYGEVIGLSLGAPAGLGALDRPAWRDPLVDHFSHMAPTLTIVSCGTGTRIEPLRGHRPLTQGSPWLPSR